MQFVNDLGQAARVVPRRTDHFGGVVLTVYQSRVTVLLQVEEALGALDVRETLRVLVQVIREPIATDQRGRQAADQLVRMFFDAALEIYQFAFEVIQDFDFGRRFPAQDLRAAGKGFAKRDVRWKHSDEPIRLPVLSTDPSHWTFHLSRVSEWRHGSAPSFRPCFKADAEAR